MSDSLDKLEELIYELVTDECFRSKQIPTKDGFDFQLVERLKEVKLEIIFLRRRIRELENKK